MSRGNEQLEAAMRSLLELLMKHDNHRPEPELEALESYVQVHEYITCLKEALFHFSIGEFDFKVAPKGTTAGYVKTIQSNIRHLAWQCKSVAEGDLNQRVDFMGSLSDTFNSMTESLQGQQSILKEQQKELSAVASRLKSEIRKKESIESALRASEETYRQRALRDPLTGLYNRGYFFESAAREMENIKRQKRAACCLMMIDIDHFKNFNDTHGHLVGDQAIRMVASAIESTLRRSDIFARYGGEEFVLLLANTGIEKGAIIAERIRVAVGSHPSPAAGCAPITISIGLTSVESEKIDILTPGDQILNDALAEADAALYTAKEKGRNMVWRYRKNSARPMNGNRSGLTFTGRGK
ncbi:hypothetical protein C4J81_09180 [Deltaproteobacteria bacterium Smac51]|nr:hypothetical protein C4J81_09180 [Deltaproteobacteria bacterium Smac51]